MDITLLIIIIVLILVISIPIIIKFRNVRLLKTVTSFKRGTKSERKLVLKLLKIGIHPQTIFHDLIIEKRNGKSSQIDLVVATTEGIIVIEVKDYGGWIYGNCSHTRWTQVLAFGKRKYRFYNPIKQNTSHIKTLKKQLVQFENITFYSIIVFYGKCELKEIDYVPKSTYLVKPHRIKQVLKIIKKENDPATYTDKREILKFLQNAVSLGSNIENQKEHIENINDTLGTDRIFD